MSNIEKHLIIEAIAYSRLVNNAFTTMECIMLHQWQNDKMPINTILKDKYNKQRKIIDHFKWSKPLLKYTDSRELFYECPEHLTWKKVNRNN